LFWVTIALGGNPSSWQLPGWQLSWVAIVLGGNRSSWQLSGWQLFWVTIALGGCCPDTMVLWMSVIKPKMA